MISITSPAPNATPTKNTGVLAVLASLSVQRCRAVEWFRTHSILTQPEDHQIRRYPDAVVLVGLEVAKWSFQPRALVWLLDNCRFLPEPADLVHGFDARVTSTTGTSNHHATESYLPSYLFSNFTPSEDVGHACVLGTSSPQSCPQRVLFILELHRREKRSSHHRSPSVSLELQTRCRR